MTDPANPTTVKQGILSDQATPDDNLNFAPYADTLAQIIADETTATPLTIGVFGSWGQGKTSLMQMIRRRLDKTTTTDFPVRSVWFNAWLYSQQPALWRALISQVLAGVRGFNLAPADCDDLEQLEAQLYGVAAPNGGALSLALSPHTETQTASLPPLVGLELLRRQAERAGDEAQTRQLTTVIADLKQSEALTRRDQLSALDHFRNAFETLSRDKIEPHGRLAIFVDDLDRCLPDKAVEVLEAIKLFLDVPGCIFVLGVAREVIEQGIKVRYADYQTTLNGAQYLEKIIQIPFSLPPIAPEAVTGYVKEIANLPNASCETVFSAGLDPNPRRIKRTLNIFLLLWRLSQNRADLKELIKPARLAKIVIIQQYHADLFRLITEGAHYLVDLEERFAAAPAEARAGIPARETEPAPEAETSAGPLAPYLTDSRLRSLLTCTPTDPEANFAGEGAAGVRVYIYLTRTTVQAAPEPKREAAHRYEPQMVTIPAGPFLMGSNTDADDEKPQHEVTLPAYAIARYPVTNAEFKRFIDNKGYYNREFWTEAGWERRVKEDWTEPRYWRDAQWNDPAQPVVGVTWFEAVAYCRWLAAETQKPYRLPTEAEWEKAARYTDGRRYPWGNEWKPDLCNSKESGRGKTTPVGDFPDGASVYGVEEMTGQVWEWCATKWGKKYPYNVEEDEWSEDYLAGDNAHMFRGGSWYNDKTACRCGYRGRSDGGGGHSSYGFRCARTLS